MDRQAKAHLEHHQKLLAGRTRLKGCADMAARAVRLQIRTGSIQSNTDQLDCLERQNDTRSALASTFGGIIRPICLAVLRLITNSNFVGCSTGRSAGLAPFKILSTYVAARRSKSFWLA